MEISNVFKDSLHYPLEDYTKLIILGVISIISNISSIYNSVGGGNVYLSGVLSVIGVIVSFILAGYILSIIKGTIDGSDIIPNFEWKNNFIMGIKYLVLSIIYFIIPTIIVLVVAWATGFFDAGSALGLIDFGNFAVNQNAINSTVAGAIPQQTFDTFVTSSVITVVVAIIVFILFGLFEIVGECRLAETGELSEGLSIGEILSDISAIGWGNFIIWIIVLAIILLILAFIFAIVSYIPYIGAFIAAIIIQPFIIMFMARAMGLMYASK